MKSYFTDPPRIRLLYWPLLLLVVLTSLAVAAREVFEFEYPDYFPPPAYDFSTNPLDSAGIELGRRLFYDEILSADTTVSCASCHSPYSAFAHTDHDLSHGIHDRIGTRNAPALFNLAWSTSFHRDGAHHHLDLQALAPLSHPDEMGSSINEAVGRLNDHPLYPARFALAFGDSLVTGERMLKALAQFQLTLVSAGAKYDRVRTGKDTFTVQEAKGYSLFKENCNSCHTEPIFTNNQFEHSGLEVDTTLNDFGRMMITTLPSDSLRFKVPSLRNLSYTHPYMHDGRFRKLRDVLKNYANQLDNPFPLSSNDQSDLIAFLLTLDDPDFVFNRKHGFPR
ncbi:c-type cytochrome [Neolewinella aurantiaca]|uniref:C-type cytochrome n=1 Tax=Neolewinella aurantiaca TaxID=2602767 RepID=A0A5C7FGF5_9BACT|nr:cytochrome-c peroxidase [Neolewinella aurantiaca]TXF90324.1 c-type cytochrome [Neolewinella aurantiaca]